MAIKCLPLSEVKEGMILAKPVQTDKGLVLCSEGTTLTQKHLFRFNEMNLRHLYVKWDQPLTQEEYILNKNKIEKNFQNIPKQSLLGRIKNILLELLESQMKP